MKKQKRNQGFTLTETIVVIAITGILFSIIALITASFYQSYQRTIDNTKKDNEITEVFNMMNSIFNEINSTTKTFSFGESDDGTLTIVSSSDNITFNLPINEVNQTSPFVILYRDVINEYKYITNVKIDYVDNTSEGLSPEFSIVTVTVITVTGEEKIRTFKVLTARRQP